ncbi:hypothetical protein B9G69_015420 [Bdellovibrio sp. SKB1291214]|uniref:hypothetical protein n=1 Tax=Bdellovibrio sp. SKB1291214 TaxID=1732569 RepID=UPI00223ECAE7|nr:hypothetical protein [Bdellovibrio sp. SKB1291214]UYL08432.1 hypothetical protein B9G69_015420 [Bdellovibrio sp. SKB1291214]
MSLKTRKVIKMLVIVVGFLSVSIVGGIATVLISSKNTEARAQDFCDQIQIGKSLDEVMQLTGASSFDKMVLRNPAGDTVNAANRGTFSPAKWAGFKDGSVVIWFHSISPALARCEVAIEDSLVSTKFVKSGS